jgi:hypothetical protein
MRRLTCCCHASLLHARHLPLTGSLPFDHGHVFAAHGAAALEIACAGAVLVVTMRLPQAMLQAAGSSAGCVEHGVPTTYVLHLSQHQPSASWAIPGC